jgi:PPP family 3-phenylpropionic acid transporter
MIPYWRLSGYYFFYFAFVGAFSPYFSLYLQSVGSTAAQIAVLMSLMSVMRMLAPALWGALADRLGVRVPIVRLSALLSMLGFAGFLVSDAYAALFASMAFLAFWSAALPLVETLTFAHLDGQSGRYGNIRVWGSVGFILAVLGLGYLLDDLPIRAVLWVTLATLGGILACALVIPEARRPAHRAAPAPGRDPAAAGGAFAAARLLLHVGGPRRAVRFIRCILSSTATARPWSAGCGPSA